MTSLIRVPRCRHNFYLTIHALPDRDIPYCSLLLTYHDLRKLTVLTGVSCLTETIVEPGSFYRLVCDVWSQFSRLSALPTQRDDLTKNKTSICQSFRAQMIAVISDSPGTAASSVKLRKISLANCKTEVPPISPCNALLWLNTSESEFHKLLLYPHSTSTALK